MNASQLADMYNGIIEMDVVVAAKASLRDSDRRISAALIAALINWPRCSIQQLKWPVSLPLADMSVLFDYVHQNYGYNNTILSTSNYSTSNSALGKGLIAPQQFRILWSTRPQNLHHLVIFSNQTDAPRLMFWGQASQIQVEKTLNTSS